MEYVLTNGKVGWKEARKLVINSEFNSTGDLPACRRRCPPMADIPPLGVDANLTTFPFKPKAPWTEHDSEMKSTDYLLMPADEDAPFADFLIGS